MDDRSSTAPTLIIPSSRIAFHGQKGPRHRPYSGEYCREAGVSLEKVYLIDDYAEGKDTGHIDLVLVGHIDQANLADLVTKTERYIGRKIRTLVLTSEEYQGTQAVFEEKTPTPSLGKWGLKAQAVSNAGIKIERLVEENRKIRNQVKKLISIFQG